MKGRKWKERKRLKERMINQKNEEFEENYKKRIRGNEREGEKDYRRGREDKK